MVNIPNFNVPLVDFTPLSQLGQTLGAGIRDWRTERGAQRAYEIGINGLYPGQQGGRTPLGEIGRYPPPSQGPVAGTPADRVNQAHQTANAANVSTNRQFVERIMPAAIEESRRTGVDPRIIVAQAALESGWGKSAPGNNLFGIKSHGRPGGNTLATTEVVNGQPRREMASFRSYASPEESVRGYGDFILQNPRYQGMRSAQGLDAQIEALAQSGYATDPAYGQKIRAIASALPDMGGGDQQALATAQPASGERFIPPEIAQAPSITREQLIEMGRVGGPEGRKMALQIMGQMQKGNAEYKVVGDSLVEISRNGVREVFSGAGAGVTERGLNPQYGVDAQGNPVLLQLGKDGTAVQTALPEGVTLSRDPIKLDAGDHYVLLDPVTRNPVGRVDKNLAEAESQKAQGKAQGEAIASLPSDILTAEQTISEIDALISHQGLASIVGPLDQYRSGMALGAEGRDALARFNQLKGRAFLQAYATLKGGGQITEIEGIKAEQAMARMDRAQGEAEFVAALRDFRDAVASGMQKIREKAGQAGGAGQITPQAAPQASPRRTQTGVQWSIEP